MQYTNRYAPIAEQPGARAEAEVVADDGADAARETNTAEVEVLRADRPGQGGTQAGERGEIVGHDVRLPGAVSALILVRGNDAR